MAGRILVVEDEPAVRELIMVSMTYAGFTVTGTEDAELAWQSLAESVPDVVLLDWMLPGMSGFQFIRHMRADSRARDIPVIMVSAREEEVDKIAALEAGADDYMTKPFSPRELVARTKAVLRRRDPYLFDEFLELGGLRLVPVTRRATVRDATLPLGPTEFRLLHFLMSHSERVLSRTQLLDQVWGGAAAVEERTVDVHIRRLRCILETHGLAHLLQTVRGLGYRFSTRLDA